SRTAAINRRNRMLKKEVQIRTNELSEVNASLIEQNEEIKAQKENLEVSNEEIQRQSEKILSQQQHIILQNRELESSVDKLRDLNQTKDHLFAILAHDLKNPVSSLTELSDFVRHNFNNINRKELGEYVEGIHRSSASIYELLLNLLNWSRTQIYKVSPQPSVCSLAEIVERNGTLLEPLMGKKHIYFESNVSRDHLVFADNDMVDAVIRNIISNSIKFTDYNGNVEIHSAEKNKTIILRITDNGIGMNSDQVEGLFKIETTRVSAGTAGEKGTGLGLVIAKEFIELNNGSILVESTQGKGSSFYVQLPAIDSEHQMIDDKITGSSILRSKAKFDFQETIPVERLFKIRGKKILIVDDNAEVRLYLKLILSDSFELFETSNGKDALKIALEIVPAIIISDVLMPDMNGFEFCRAVKQDTAISHIPVVFLTSQWDVTMQSGGYEAGADIYLTKPVKKELLVQVILNLLQNQERQRDKIVESIMSDGIVPPGTGSINKFDEAFINKLVKIIETNVSDPNLDARLLCREMATSRTVLYTKLKTLTGQSVHEIIKTIRLRKSIKLLLSGELSVSQVAFEVGFNSHSYFDKCFIKQYNMGPKEYISKYKGRI
ncbi:MAG: response regulator, partial [Bacteroidota bacterium]